MQVAPFAGKWGGEKKFISMSGFSVDAFPSRLSNIYICIYLYI